MSFSDLIELMQATHRPSWRTSEFSGNLYVFSRGDICKTSRMQQHIDELRQRLEACQAMLSNILGVLERLGYAGRSITPETRRTTEHYLASYNHCISSLLRQFEDEFDQFGLRISSADNVMSDLQTAWEDLNQCYGIMAQLEYVYISSSRKICILRVIADQSSQAEWRRRNGYTFNIEEDAFLQGPVLHS